MDSSKAVHRASGDQGLEIDMTKTFRIWATASSADLGHYEADTEAEAVRAMQADACVEQTGDLEGLSIVECMTASQVMAIARNADDAVRRAESMIHDLQRETEQDWDAEATLYTMHDGSVLAVSGPQVSAFDSMDAAKAALAE